MTSGLKRGCRFIAITFALLLVLGVGAAFWLWQGYQSFADAPLAGVSADATVEVARGDSFPAVLRKLRAQGVSEGTDLQWRVLARQTQTASQLKVGEYALEPALTPHELLQRMREGRTLQYRFTIVEGWNIRQLRAALRNATPLQQKTAQMSDVELMEALGHAGQHPEGRFLPETYVYTRSESDLDVLKRAYAAMEKAVDAAWSNRAADIPLQSAEEMLILASIIEKETGIAEERPAIAGVFARRMKLGMKLQTDPTVIYGIGSSYDGNIRRHHLTTDTPYNTYTRTGLTPTPIAMPGVEALNAAVNPAEGDALFFVAVGDGSGRHLFSATLAEHNAAVAKYLVTRRQTLDKAAQR